MIDVIREYLASVGFSVDNNSFQEVQKSFSKLEQVINQFFKKLSENKAFVAFSKHLAEMIAQATKLIGEFLASTVGMIAALTVAVVALAAIITKMSYDFVKKFADADLAVQKLAISLFTSVENARSLKAVMDTMGLKSLDDLKYVNLIPEQREQFMALRQLSHQLQPSPEVKEGLKLFRGVGYALQQLSMVVGYLWTNVAGTLAQIMRGPLKDLANGVKLVAKFLTAHMADIAENIAMALGIVTEFFAVVVQGFAVLGSILKLLGVLWVLKKFGQFMTMIAAWLLYFETVIRDGLAALNEFLGNDKPSMGTADPKAPGTVGNLMDGTRLDSKGAPAKGGKNLTDIYNLMSGGGAVSAKKPTPAQEAGQKLVGSVKTGNSKIDEAYNYLRAQGYSHAGAAAIIGNLKHESGFLDKNVKGTHWDVNGPSGGLAQWHDINGKGRLTSLRNYLKRSFNTDLEHSTLQQQLSFLTHELQGYPSLNKNLKTGTDAKSLAGQFVREFERPKDPVGQSRLRGQTAESLSKSIPQLSVNINVHGVKDPELVAQMVSRKLQTALNSRNLQGAYA